MNVVLLTGYLGADAETITYPEGGTRTTFRMATTERGKMNKETGQVYPDRTTWHNVHVWGKLAESCKSLRKGERVGVLGAYEDSEYRSADGATLHYFYVNAQRVEFLSPKSL